MKRFLVKTALFLAIIFIADRSVGYVFPRIQKHKGQKNDYTYMFDKCEAEVLIFGSSRAYRHYNPRIIEDSLGLSCYNCGESSMGFIHNYAILQEMMNRYTPKVIIYDFNPYIDIIKDRKRGNYAFLKGLKPYHSRQGIEEVILSIDKNERYKMLSDLYNHNQEINSILNGYIELIPEDGAFYNGFIGTKSKFMYKKVQRGDRIAGHELDEQKMEYLIKFVDKAKDCKLIFCISPRWFGLGEFYVDKAREISLQYDIPFIDFSNNPKYVHHNELFYDGTHMNARGADEFTRDLIKELKKYDCRQ